MASHLVIQVHLHDRFHGVSFGSPEWPPSPARLFQALVAGVARGAHIGDEMVRAMVWLEGLPPPRVGVPPSSQGSEVVHWVPNNDLDSVGGDPKRIGEIRTKKAVRPRLMHGDAPLLFVWSFEQPSEHVDAIVEAAEQLYQFGRGIDLAWARAEVLTEPELEQRLAAYPGQVLLPGQGQSTVLCPVPGSLESLRHRFSAQRLRAVVEGRRVRELFENAPKPVFRTIRYGTGRKFQVYRLVASGGANRPEALRTVARLVEGVRDAAAARLRAALPGSDDAVERILVGRKADGRDAGPADERVRIVPLPSVGHLHADRAVRRIAVAIPQGTALAEDDLAWAFDGLELPSEEGAENRLLVREEPSSMFGRYARSGAHFRSVTPAALPVGAARRRIDPARRLEDAKGGQERIEEERRAAWAVRAALRHAGVRASVAGIRVQREPFDRRGVRAEAFAPGTRFAKERLWHVEIFFREPVEGPLVVGDGRFLGLGVMRPVAESRRSRGMWAFELEGPEVKDHEAVVQAFRRAVMARVGGESRVRPLDPFFSGHDESGAPVRRSESSHLAFHWNPRDRRLLVLAPHRLDRRQPTDRERGHLRTLQRALLGLTELVAGRAGRFALRPVDPEAGDGAHAPSRRFVSVTPYAVTRHARKQDAYAIIEEDIQLECRRRGLPPPRVSVLEAVGIPRKGLQGSVRLEFDRAVEGPLALGRTRYVGGGLFLPAGADV